MFNSKVALVLLLLSMTHTFDLQDHLILTLAQNVTGDAGVRALIFRSSLFDLQSTVVIQLILTTIKTTTLAILEPEHTQYLA